MDSTKLHTKSDTRTGQIASSEAFAQTSWTTIDHAKNTSSPEARQALAELCRIYWGPIHSYARRSGYLEQDAKDLTQEFFLQLLRGNFFAAADRTKGKFRSFLLTAFNHFLSGHRKKTSAAKRGGGQAAVSLDECDDDGRPLHEPATDLSPVKLFERRWALTLFQHTFGRLQGEYAGAGKAALFEHLKPFLESATGKGSYDEVAAKLQMTSNALGVNVHRMRHRFGQLVREEVVRTLVDPTEEEIRAEIRHLYDTLS